MNSLPEPVINTSSIHINKIFTMHSVTSRLKAVFDKKLLNNTTENNRLVRITNSLIKAMKDEAAVPKILVVVLEDDIIRYVNFNDYRVTTLFGRVIEFLSTTVRQVIDQFKEQYLPTRAKKEQYPMIIWITPTIHMHYRNNNLCRKFANEMESQVPTNHHAFCSDVLWNSQSPAVVNDMTGKMIPAGIRRYWHAVDRLIRYANTYFFDSVQEEQNDVNSAGDTRRVQFGNAAARMNTTREVTCRNPQHGRKYHKPQQKFFGRRHNFNRNYGNSNAVETTIEHYRLRRQPNRDAESPLAEEL